jgi:hypothetical protein
MTFVHTIADNEAAAERRDVVALAERYLRERAIVPQRIFTVSATEYQAARSAGLAPAAWNEVGALQSTLENRAEEHMARLDRAERDRTALERIAETRSQSAPNRSRSFFDKLFGRR